ncbi:hypothetical protein VTN77DRAFT_6822 [Rasamsonia byssochlamydoides]|uniref:uncharacterized protein n=1 Tax=Rasamsonia byssochlamydoides TaxID=89139 RepID=UPI00374203A6
MGGHSTGHSKRWHPVSNHPAHGGKPLCSIQFMFRRQRDHGSALVVDLILARAVVRRSSFLFPGEEPQAHQIGDLLLLYDFGKLLHERGELVKAMHVILGQGGRFGRLEVDILVGIVFALVHEQSLCADLTQARSDHVHQGGCPWGHDGPTLTRRSLSARSQWRWSRSMAKSCSTWCFMKSGPRC